MKIKVYNMAGKEVGEHKLAEKVFGVELNQGLIHQVVVAQMANARKSIAHAKDRSEVRGGGKKPWRQKGTGRARHGSIRSPLWVGGGVTFGPSKIRNFSKKINDKMKQRALRMALTAKVSEKTVVVLDNLEVKDGKTKVLAELIKNLPLGKKVLLALDEKDDQVIRSAANLQNITTIAARNLNLVDLMKNQTLLTTVKGIQVIEKTL